MPRLVVCRQQRGRIKETETPFTLQMATGEGANSSVIIAGYQSVNLGSSALCDVLHLNAQSSRDQTNRVESVLFPDISDDRVEKEWKDNEMGKLAN